MAASPKHRDQKRRRRSKLWKGLLVGGAAVGIPAIANALISKRSRALGLPSWGRHQRYAWKYGEISFQTIGRGEPVVLIHSFGPGHDSEEWRQVGELLANRNRVYAVDLLGWGRSDKPKLTYDGEVYIQLITSFLQDVVGQPCVVAAAGLPAAYAIQIAVDHPELVRALALVVPSGLAIHSDEPDIKDALLNRLLRLPIVGTTALNLFTSRSGLGQHLRREVFTSAEQVDAARLDHYYRSSHQTGAHVALAAYLSGYLNHGVDDELPRLNRPVWLAWGREAENPSLETSDFWLQRLPDCGLDVFENSGNLPHLETASVFTTGFKGFLSSL
jgi:pimeloyl-ACP methyl ester carboxylesterase